MKLRPTKRAVEVQKETQQKKERKTGKNTLPPDGYQPLFPPARFLVREEPSRKDPSKTVKQYLEISVKRYEDDDMNQPYVWITMYQESEFYTGYLKGKTIYFPVSELATAIEYLGDVSDMCEEMHIE